MIKQIKNPVILAGYFFIPSIIITGFFLLFTHPVIGIELNTFLALGIAGLLGLLPTELGIMLYHSKKENNTFDISCVVPYQNKLPMKKLILVIIGLVVFAVLVMVLGAPVSVWIKDHIFSFIPDWFVIGGTFESVSRRTLWLILIVSIIVTGIILPIVEELYFRGFLLPRMEHLKGLAPILNALLFALYHFWSPWLFLTRTVALIPFSYVSYKTKNVTAVIIAHILINIMGDSIAILLLLV